MSGPFDWVALAIFAAVAVLFLQRSVGPERPGDRTWLYLPPAIGCAAGNWLGNAGQVVWGTIALLTTCGYVLLVLKPGRNA